MLVWELSEVDITFTSQTPLVELHLAGIYLCVVPPLM